MENLNIDGRAVAAQLLDGIAQDVAALKKENWFPKLVSIKVGNDDSVELYIRNQKRIAGKVDIEFVERHSEIVGKPIAFLLMAEGATVTVCRHMHFSGGVPVDRQYRTI